MLMAQSVRLAAALVTLAMAFMMMVSGFAVVVLRVLLREQTIPRLAPQRLTLNEILIRALERSESLTTTEHSDHFCVQAVHCWPSLYAGLRQKHRVPAIPWQRGCSGFGSYSIVSEGHIIGRRA
jgi:hypothetical protein